MKPLRSPGPRAVRLLNVVLVLVMLLSVSAAAYAAPTTDTMSGAARDSGTDGVAHVEFTLPNAQAVDDLVALGADLAEHVQRNADGTVTVSAIVTPEERAYYESLGYIRPAPRWRIARPGQRREAEREAAIAAERAAKNAAESNAPAGSKSHPTPCRPTVS